MPWVRIDDDFHGHPKVLAAGLAGAGLYTRALSYCGKYLTDGYVPDTWVAAAIAGERRDTPRRVEAAGLWQRAPDGRGWLIPDFLEFNPSAKDVKLDRDLGRVRAQRSRDRTALKRLGCMCSDPLDPAERHPNCPAPHMKYERPETRGPYLGEHERP